MQVVFYRTDFEQQLQDVLAGNIDVAFVTTGWMEANHPEVMQNLRIHHSNNEINLFYKLGVPPLFQSEPIPFETSTDLIALNGFSAAPHIDPTMRELILHALIAMNDTAAMNAAGLSEFTISSSYVYPRTLAIDAGTMFAPSDADVRTRCLSAFLEPYDIVTCPPGYELLEQQAAEANCNHLGRPCPPGQKCLCQPCTPLQPTNVYPWPMVLGLCCSLFFVGLCFSFCGQIPLDSTAHLIQVTPPPPPSDRGSFSPTMLLRLCHSAM